MGTKLGILSLSETPSSPVMWAHYADNHSGFLIVFDEQHPWFCAKMGYEDEFRHLRKVSYVDRSELRYLADLQGQDIFYSKLADWKYEREWRIIRPLQDSSAVLGDVYLFDLPADSIKGIVTGLHANSESTAELKTILDRNPNLRHVRIGHAVRSRVTNSIEIDPVL